MRPEDELNPVDDFLNGLELFRRTGRFLEQSGLEWSVSKLIAISAAMAIAGFAIGSAMLPSALPRIITVFVSLASASAPYLFVARKRRKKLAQFEEQFPEALDFLSRSMRAGHAFSISLEMLVADSPQPLQSAFREVLNDVQLGSSLDAALARLAYEIPLIDVRFFVSSVILQQGTGGNLSEVLNSMARIIRERFQVKGKVKAVSAHGKVTGLVLSLMPIVVGAIMLVTSPAYVLVLFRDPDGRKLLYAAMIGQILRVLVYQETRED